VASRDWINKDYIIKEVPAALIRDAANFVYMYRSTDVFRDESLDKVPIQRRASIYNRYRHLCPSSCLTLSFAAALCSHRCELKMNLHPRRYHYDTVERRGRKPRVDIQSSVGYSVCCGTRGVVLCNSHDVEIVQDAGSVFNPGRTDNGAVGRKNIQWKGWQEEVIYILEFLRSNSYLALCWLINRKRPSLHLAQPPSSY